MIDVWTEQLLTLPVATHSPAFARCGKPIHIATLFRYISRGVKARNGERVRLEVVRIPSGSRTSREAIQRFIERINSEDPPGVTPGEVMSTHVLAEAHLKSAGM